MNEEVRDQKIVAPFVLIFSLKWSWYIIAILRSSQPENLQNSQANNCAEVPFLTKLQDRYKRDFNRVFFKNTSGRLLWILSFLSSSFTHCQNNWNFSRKVYFSNNLFSVYVWLLNHEAKACWWVQQKDKTAIMLTKYLCKRENKKIRDFLRSFSLKLLLFDQGSLPFLV